MEKRPGYGYLRVSGKSQVAGDGFERQRVAILEAAEREGIEICKWYEEKGVSGKTEWEARPAWVEMVLESQTSGVKCVLIEKLDRSARDLMVQEHIIVDLKRRGIELVSACEPGLGSDDPTRVMMRQIMGAIAQYDKTMTVLKLRAARDRIRKIKGKCGGPKYYGEDNPEERKVVAWMVEMRDKGYTLTDIAWFLERKCIETPQTWKQKPDSKGWHPWTVKRILDRAKEGKGLAA